jgi:hypothetical protein
MDGWMDGNGGGRKNRRGNFCILKIHKYPSAIQNKNNIPFIFMHFLIK